MLLAGVVGFWLAMSLERPTACLKLDRMLTECRMGGECDVGAIIDQREACRRALHRGEGEEIEPGPKEKPE
jgi:hypothetical protein